MAAPAWKETYGQATARVGVGAATPEVNALFKKAFEIRQEKADAARIAARGTLEKANPHVTDFGKCPRKVWLSLANEPVSEPLIIQSHVNFAVGAAVEEFFGSLITEIGGTFEREAHVTFPGDPPVTGRIDYLLALDELDALVELKSTSSLAMKLSLQANELPKDDHKRQIRAYLAASEKGYIDGHEPKTYKHGYLVYVVKDAKKGQEPIQAFYVAHEPGLVEADLAWLRGVAAMKEAPPIPEFLAAHKANKGKLHWQCGYCPYRTYCWGGAK